ncbi:ABC transporter ATP-binding protein [Spirochaeta africana]|uniref:ABC-type antimicrobial peptide transport system, ATPase component n=1 Tax=Spirochaeta africana (strain ATCC 700263 / DSM 8902 / Z-7692) TaxID=889378 RepID=H9UFI9_SPIAZ|nr:ABC transporter ATP-binding protein [Spirochaeta africana]AFG36282.1 ABC-type antimicrobial peptide transport system, ATPase component [Spirochaeta africana DSM 8902]
MIKIQNVYKTYIDGDTEVRALRGVSLDIAAGEFMSIAGPSGSGKTTLLNLIGCIDELDAGEIRIQEHAVSLLNKSQLTELRRSSIGYIFQSFNLIPVLSAYENVAIALSLLNLSRDEVHRRTMTILQEVGLEGMEHRRPAKLSGGQQQRVAVARALVKDPLIVLADEPTANLDSETGEAILQLMKRINETHGTTFIFSTHDPMVMHYADRLCQLHDGKVERDERVEAAVGGA